MKVYKDLLIITLFALTLTFLVWLPHYLNLHSFYGLDFSNGFNNIYRNYDGLEYIVISKSFYLPEAIAKIPQPMPAGYYASHFPGYALLIAAVAPVFGYLKAMLVISILSTIAAAWVFYLLLHQFKLTTQPLWLSIVFLVLPARWLIVHSAGSAEPTFILMTLLAVYFFLKFERLGSHLFLWLSAISASLAQLTRPPGLLLVIALALYIHWQLFRKAKQLGLKAAILDHLRYLPFLLVPLTLVGVFAWFNLAYGDFWAYFHSGDNIHLTFPPFQVFNRYQFWVGDIWLEDIVYIFALGFLAGLLLIKQKLYPLAFFVLTYLVASTIIVHRDVSRYTLPIFPFVLIAFEKVLVSREFKIVLCLIALGIYLYSQNFIIQNTAPVSNLSLFN